jgi:hypothetical protein
MARARPTPGGRRSHSSPEANSGRETQSQLAEANPKRETQSQLARGQPRARDAVTPHPRPIRDAGSLEANHGRET